MDKTRNTNPNTMPMYARSINIILWLILGIVVVVVSSIYLVVVFFIVYTVAIDTLKNVLVVCRIAKVV